MNTVTAPHGPATGRAVSSAHAWMLGLSHGIHHVLAVPLAPLLLLVTADLGEPLTRVAVAIGIGDLCGGLLQFVVGTVADRFGRKRILMLGFAAQITALLILASAHHLLPLAAGLVLLGVGNSTYHPASFSLVAAEKSPLVNSRFAFHNSFGLVGTAVSFTVYATLAQWLGWRPALLVVAGLTVFFAVGFGLTVKELQSEPKSERESKTDGPAGQAARETSRSRSQRVNPLGAVIIGVFSFISGSFVQGLAYILPTFLVLSHGLGLDRASTMVTTLFLIGGIGTLFGGRWIDKVGEVKAMLVGGGSAAVLMLYLALFAPSIPVMVLIMGGIGFGQSIARTAMTGEITRMRDQSMGGMFGLQFGAVHLGGAICIPLLAWVVERFSATHAAIWLAPPLAIYGFAALLLRRTRNSVS